MLTVYSNNAGIVTAVRQDTGEEGSKTVPFNHCVYQGQLNQNTMQISGAEQCNGKPIERAWNVNIEK